MKNRRTLAEARAEFIECHGEPCSVEEAEQRIIAELADGRRRAEGVLPGGIDYEPISEALWHQAKEPSPSYRPQWERPVGWVAVDFEAGSAIAKTGRGYLHIREILDPPPDEPPVPADRTVPAPQRPKNPGGAPARYDWERIWIEIVAIANTPDGLPDRPTLMRLLYDKMVIEWDLSLIHI